MPRQLPHVVPRVVSLGLAWEGSLIYRVEQTGLVVLMLLTAFAANAAVQREIPFETSRAFGLILVNVEVNGKRAVFVVDTGSNQTVLNWGTGEMRPRILENITSVHKSSGPVATGVFGKATVKIGAVVWRDHSVIITDMRELSRTLGQQVDGVLGMDFLGEFELVTVDLKRHLLVLQN